MQECLDQPDLQWQVIRVEGLDVSQLRAVPGRYDGGFSVLHAMHHPMPYRANRAEFRPGLYPVQQGFCCRAMCGNVETGAFHHANEASVR